MYLYEPTSSKLINVINSKEETVLYNYNEEGALTSVIYPDETSMIIEYNDRGLLVNRKMYDIGQLRQSMKYEYHEGGGLFKTLWPDASTFEYILNEDGNVAAIKRYSFLTNRWETHVNMKTVYQGDSVRMLYNTKKLFFGNVSQVCVFFKFRCIIRICCTYPVIKGQFELFNLMVYLI